MTICPLHRDKFGLRWRCNKTQRAVPDGIAAHKSSSVKGQCGVASSVSCYVYSQTKTLLPVGTGKCILLRITISLALIISWEIYLFYLNILCCFVAPYSLLFCCCCCCCCCLFYDFASLFFNNLIQSYCSSQHIKMVRLLFYWVGSWLIQGAEKWRYILEGST